jgi:hypothetical protein
MTSIRLVTLTSFLVAAGLGSVGAQTSSGGACDNLPSNVRANRCDPAAQKIPDRPGTGSRQRQRDFESGREAWRQAGEQWRRQRDQARSELEKRKTQTPEAKEYEFDKSVADYYKSVPGIAKDARGRDSDKLKAGKKILEKGGKMYDAYYGGLLGAVADDPENQRAIAELEKQIRRFDYDIEFSQRMIDDIVTEWQRSNAWQTPAWMREYLKQVIEKQQQSNRLPPAGVLPPKRTAGTPSTRPTHVIQRWSGSGWIAVSSAADCPGGVQTPSFDANAITTISAIGQCIVLEIEDGTGVPRIPRMRIAPSAMPAGR